ncbi:hypothetical protein H312_00588 [Anncaliia algerae PRA339]|uniref:Sm domain-containing protein n=1 Tax=Anncaliia algerae PRA339 TaxID=1288291 RepID=A0A059F421_9MICR|nr:hypothetical protein H312_00588 [Anncaliia algerae PRA339]
MPATNIFESFINKEISVKTQDTMYYGKLISIDGYLNCILENSTIVFNNNELKEDVLFIKGASIDHISIK